MADEFAGMSFVDLAIYQRFGRDSDVKRAEAFHDNAETAWSSNDR
jgi:hypothetical protein